MTTVITLEYIANLKKLNIHTYYEYWKFIYILLFNLKMWIIRVRYANYWRKVFPSLVCVIDLDRLYSCKYRYTFLKFFSGYLISPWGN